MAGKYRIPKESFEELKGIIAIEMQDKYHAFYESLGCKHVSGQSFHCINTSAHNSGEDKHPSMSICNETGLGNCKACGIRFNLQSFYKQFIAGGSLDLWSGSFLSMMVDKLNLTRFINFGDSADDANKKRIIAQMKALHEKLNKEYVVEKGMPFVSSSDSKAEVEKIPIDIAVNDALVDRLLNDAQAMQYLNAKRGVSEEIIKEYRIGLTEYGQYSFPMFNKLNELVNIQLYNPRGDRKYKWCFMFENCPVKPMARQHFNGPRIDIHEGFPDVLTSIGLGLRTAITMGGATNTDVARMFGEDEAKRVFTGKTVNIIMDSDREGRKAALEIAQSVSKFTGQVKIIDLDKSEINPFGLDPKGMKSEDGKKKRSQKDFTDYMRLQGTLEQALQRFGELLDKTPVYVKEAEEKDDDEEDDSCSPARLADSFLQFNNLILDDGRPLLRYWHQCYWRYTGKKWQAVSDSEMESWVVCFLRNSLVTKDSSIITKKLAHDILTNLKGFYIPDDIRPPVFISGQAGLGDFTVKTGNFIALENGILSMDAVIAGETENVLQPHTPDFFSIVALPYEYDPSADCPKFKAFLNSVLPDDSLQKILIEFFGYCFLPNSNQHKFLILVGEGANGKGVCLVILIGLLGKENVSAVPMELFGESSVMVETRGKLANVVTEISEPDRTSEGILKAIAAGETINFNPKFKNSFSEKATCKLIFSTNILPHFKDKTDGIWRRLLMIPFDIIIPEVEQDKKLSEKLMVELPGIFNMVIGGLKSLLQRGYFNEPSACKTAKSQYQLELNPAKRFLEEECEACQNGCYRTSELYMVYSQYCKTIGQMPCADAVFGKEIRRVYPKVIKCKKGSEQYYTGIAVLKKWDDIIHMNRNFDHLRNVFGEDRT